MVFLIIAFVVLIIGIIFIIVYHKNEDNKPENNKNNANNKNTCLKTNDTNFINNEKINVNNKNTFFTTNKVYKSNGVDKSWYIHSIEEMKQMIHVGQVSYQRGKKFIFKSEIKNDDNMTFDLQFENENRIRNFSFKSLYDSELFDDDGYIFKKEPKPTPTYISYCWNCKSPIDNVFNQKCPKCNRYYICSKCGNCKCDWGRHRRHYYKYW